MEVFQTATSDFSMRRGVLKMVDVWFGYTTEVKSFAVTSFGIRQYVFNSVDSDFLGYAWQCVSSFTSLQLVRKRLTSNFRIVQAVGSQIESHFEHATSTIKESEGRTYKVPDRDKTYEA